MSKPIIWLFFIIFVLSACTGDNCIDADDFGFAKFTISSRYEEEELYEQQQDNQIAPWRNSEFRVNGAPLTIVVKTWKHGTDKNKSWEVSAWCAWYGEKDNTATLSTFCERLQECKFYNQMCTNTKDAEITNAPCLFKNGVGLYALMAEKGTDPNLSFEKQRSPDGITLHLGEPTQGYKLYDISQTGETRPAGGINYNYEGKDKTKYNDNPLYFKILDKFYDDNNGQYKIVIKSGIWDNREDPISFLTKLIKDQLFGDDYGLVKTVYQNIIKNPAYQLSVSALLTLYIIFTALSYFTGNLNVTHTEIIIRVVKVGIVSALLTSEYSWSFFNDYLYVYFVDGVEEILAIIQDAGAVGPGSTNILNLMLAPQTMAKLFAVLFAEWNGFIYIILYFVALYFIILLTLQGTIIYLIALIAIGMIITMGPIFICFLLFGITRSLFENWLRQLISYSLQPIILFTGLAFIAIIIRTEIYSTLGFRVCKHDFPNLGTISEIFGGFTNDLDSSISQSIFYWWFPLPITHTDPNKDKVMIPVPQDHKKDDGSYCVAYECLDERFVELPFLDPDTDQDRINSFANGNFVHLDGLLLIFVSLYLLSKFNGLSVSIARFISSTSGNLTSVQSMGQQAFAPIKRQFDKFTGVEVAGKAIDKAREAVSSRAAGLYEKVMMDRLKKQALDPSSANEAVLAEVKRSYGIDSRDVKVNAIKDYEHALEEKLKQINPNLSKKELQENLRRLTEGDYRSLKDKLAAVKFGKEKDYSSLADLDKKQIDEIMKAKYKDQSLRELYSDAKFARDFQQYYAQAHQDLSERGVGLFGKNISALRSWQELSSKVKTEEELKKARRRNIGERMYAGYEGLKRDLLTSITGEELRNSLEGSLTGAAWHDFNYNDPRLRTYSEELKDNQRSIEHQELQAKINQETINAQDDVLKPEYLVRLSQTSRDSEREYYEQLSKAKIAYEVYSSLTAGDDPVLMGDKFMQEKALDSQMREMIDNAYLTQEQFIENDRYARRQEHYEIMNEKAAEYIVESHNLLTDYYQRDDIKTDEMPDLLEQYYNQISGQSNQQEIDKLRKAMEDFEYSRQIFDKIEERKEQIREEFAGHIQTIHRYRQEAKMPEYNEGIEVSTRKLRTIDQHLRKLK